MKLVVDRRHDDPDVVAAEALLILSLRCHLQKEVRPVEGANEFPADEGSPDEIGKRGPSRKQGGEVGFQICTSGPRQLLLK